MNGVRPRLLLALAIALEVTGTMALRPADGFSRPGWALVVVLAYGSSMAVFARAMAGGLGLGAAYATLTGIGLIAATLASAVVFDEGLSPVHAASMGLLLVGVVLLQARVASGAAP